MTERRRDSRSDALYSLRNLLRIRANKFNWPMLVLGTSSDLVLAASREDRAAEQALLRASNFAGRNPGRTPDHTSLRFTAHGQTLVLVTPGRPAGSRTTGFLESVLLGSVAHSVRRILAEAAARAVA